MARVPSKHSRDQAQDFEGLLNNLQDWELSFKDKDKKLRSDDVSKGKLSNADAEFALRLEPQNQEIKKQYAELKSLLEKEILKKASGGLAGSVRGAQPGKSKVDRNKNVQKLQSVSTSSPAGRVAEILEDHAEKKTKDSKQEVRASVQELAKAASLAKAEAAKNIVPPNSAYQFEVSWRGLSGDRDLQARLLKVTSPTALPGIFRNALSASILVDIIRCIATFFTEDMALGVEYLQNLAKIPRFDMIIMCLSPTDKADLSKIWNEVFSKGTTDYADILGICLEEKAVYLVDQQDFIPERNANVPCSLGRLEGLPELKYTDELLPNFCGLQNSLMFKKKI
ncbi:UNVERIFIED_CONTAM: hypothetical protein Scaly_1412400 [Sesamum calycinum]|uniref:RNA-polymerase II-associated protein 3-like C-terminal domain-containing protein n=1 Tax=Sesamum calycinum TaxID=2727403 RepID=A0AAW2PQB2_9LAMI